VENYTEDGLGLLFSLSSEPEFANDRLEDCRLLAQQDGRFAFIYSFPRSAGFGAAIGATVQTALYGEFDNSATIVTALLNVFMTLLDGVLDNAPEVLSPHLDGLLAMVCDGASGGEISETEAPSDHPYNTLCFLAAKLWIRKLREAGVGLGSSETGKAIAGAIRSAMLAEYANSRARFAKGKEVSAEALYGRCRWPVWVQVLACVGRRGWPAGVASNACQEFIFRVADYTSHLDDFCDFVADCRSRQWNTISYQLWQRDRFPFSWPDQLQRQLLIRLADNQVVGHMIQQGIECREAVAGGMAALALPEGGFDPLLADLTYAYLR
jgi:hypothetical protein